MFGGKTEGKDLIRIEITENGKVVHEAQGDWLSYVKLGDDVEWQLDQATDFWLKGNGKDTLHMPSDSSKRLDIQYMVEDMMDYAEKAKYEMEE